MVDRLLSVSTVPLSLKNRSNNQQKQSFKDVLDTSLSDQKSLQEELRLQKKSDKKQEIENLRKTIERIKKQNTMNSPELDQVSQIVEKLLVSLEENIEFIDKNYVEDFDKDESFDLGLLIQSTQDFLALLLDNTNTGLVQDHHLVLAEKTSFILDDIHKIDVPIAQDSVQAGVLMDLVQELKSASDTSQLVLHEFSQQDNEISLDDFSVALSTEKTEPDNNHHSDLDQHFNSDESSEKLVIKDLRTHNKIKILEESFSLENMDAPIQSSDVSQADPIILENSSTQSVLKYDLASSAQKAYTSFSSSVSRVQVEALMQSMAGKAAIILQDGGSELRMKLTPPELGQMKLSFMIEDSIMQGKVVVETQEAKMFFEQNIDNLRESLARAGVKLSNVDVELGGRGEFTSRDENDGTPIKALRTPSTQEAFFPIRKAMISDSLVDFTA